MHCYGGHYYIRMRVRREALDVIEKTARQIRKDYKYVKVPGSYECDQTINHEEALRRILPALKEAKEKGEDPAVVEIDFGVSDDNHGFIANYMNPIQEAVPDMELAVYADFNDHDYDDHYEGYAFKSKEDDPIPFNSDDDIEFINSQMSDSPLTFLIAPDWSSLRDWAERYFRDDEEED